MRHKNLIFGLKNVDLGILLGPVPTDLVLPLEPIQEEPNFNPTLTFERERQTRN